MHALSWRVSFIGILPFVLLLQGCGEFIQSKRYTDNIALPSHIALSITPKDNNSIASLFERNGFHIDPLARYRMDVTLNPEHSSCSVTRSHVIKEYFIRISVMDAHTEVYRIQRNQKEPMTEKTIQSVIERMKKELK